MDQQGQRRSELQSQLIERATRDQGFRQELVRDPRGVIQLREPSRYNIT